MTLGLVIGKLHEADKRGHVPYRNSKLTRILQPVLGGNANIAMICNITLARIHVDETKSTLRFASKASHVKNYTQADDEILPDAALLELQKKEIEELHAKLQVSHSERERIAFELEEEKKAQAEREKEQAKKIENVMNELECYRRKCKVLRKRFASKENSYFRNKSRRTNMAEENSKSRGASREPDSSCRCTRFSMCRTRDCKCKSRDRNCDNSCSCRGGYCLNTYQKQNF